MADAKDWAGDLGANWAAVNDAMDRQLAPALPLGIAALAPRCGERIIDLGCGGGASSLAIAEAVGAEGTVLGVDISPDLARIAEERTDASSNVAIVVGDASQHPFEDAGFDALFTRFGCMFFEKPVEAMAHLRRALVPGGRAVLTVWAEPERNPWATIPAKAAADVLGPAEAAVPGAPGPFGWASPRIYEPILAEAGYRYLIAAEHEIRMPVSLGADPDPVVRAIRHMQRIGPLSRRLAEDPDALDEIAGILRPALMALVEGDAVCLPGCLRILQATA